MKKFIIIAFLIIYPKFVLSDINNSIILGEYFFDIDPGLGNGISFVFNSENCGYSNFYMECGVADQIEVETSQLSVGHHFLFVRLKSKKGIWSKSSKRIFSITGENKIVDGEYYITENPENIDDDPGIGNAIPLTMEINDTFLTNIDTSTLPIGKQYICVRLKDSEGKWGPIRQYRIEIRDPNATTIIKAEYIIDKNDYEIGNAIPLTPNESGFFEENIDTSSMNFGIHTISIRIMDSLYRWGNFEKQNFEIREHQHPIISGNITTFVAGWQSLPVRNATVELKGTGYITETDSKGNFELLDIPVGEYILVVNADGLIPISKTLIWTGLQNLYLKEMPIPLTIFDPDKNGRVGLEEAINALQIVAGIHTIDYSEYEIPDDSSEKPSASCSTTKFVHCGDVLILDASDSFDRYNYDSISYYWEHIDGVNGSFSSGQFSEIAKFISSSATCEVGKTSTFKLTVTNQWGIEDTTECQVSYQSKLIEIQRYKFEDTVNNTYDLWATTESDLITYTYDSSIGYALTHPIEGKTLPIYSCEAIYHKENNVTMVDRYLSKDRCVPQYCLDFVEWRSLNLEPIFYLYKDSGENRVLVRRCWTDDPQISDTFTSNALSCNDDVSGSDDVKDDRSPLGYAVKSK